MISTDEYVVDQQERNLIRNVTDQLWGCHDRVTDDEHDLVPLRNDERQVLERLTDNGYTICGTGIARVVVRPPERTGDDYVFKLARFGDSLLSIGMFQNWVEVQTWVDTESNVLLPPVAWEPIPHKCRWVAYPYITPIYEADVGNSKRENLIEEIKTCVEQLPLDPVEVCEVNIGYRDGNAYLYDYGRLDTDDTEWSLRRDT